MDPITHTLAGATIFNLGFKRRFALWVILISSIAPDFDYITRLWGIDVFLRYHRGITHGILALFIIPLLIGLIFGHKKGFFYYTFLSFTAYALHLFLDLTNQYGTRILSPLDWEQYSLDLVFIIDPYVTLGFLLSLIICKVNKKRALIVALLTFILLILYISGRAYLQAKMREFVKERIDAQVYRIYPLPNDFLRWWFVTQIDNKINVGFADLFTQRLCIQDTYSLEEKNPYIEKSKDVRVVKNFIYFARFPYAEVKRDTDNITVIWRELSYSFRAGEHFVAKVLFDKDGNVINSYFKF